MTLDASGLTIKTAAEIRAEMQTSIRSALGSQVQLDSASTLGKIVDVFSLALAECWEELRATYDSLHVEAAAGTQLDDLVAIRGVTRLDAAPSTVDLTFSGTNGVTIPVGTEARVPNGLTFVTVESGEIAAGTITLSAEATEDGPLEAASGTITEMVTYISGVSAVTNAADAAIGRNAETDSALRFRQGSIQDHGTVDAVAAHILHSDSGVNYVFVEDNRTTATVDGMVGHSVRATVYPAPTLPEVLAQHLFHAIPAGIETNGDQTYSVEDTQGGVHVMRWRVATQVEWYVSVTISTQAGFYAGDDEVVAAILAVAADLGIGATFYLSRAIAAVVAVGGVLDVTITTSADDITYTAANIVPATDEIITIPSVNVTVQVV